MSRFNLPSGRLGFGGSMLLAGWNGSTSSVVWGFPQMSFSFNVSDNAYFPQAADANSNLHLKNLGLRVGTLEFAAPVLLDRGAIAFWNYATQAGTRGNQFQATITPFSGASAINCGNIGIRQLRLASQTAVDGRSSMWIIQGTAFVCDPDNAQGLTSLTAAGTLGTNGNGIASFMSSFLTDTANVTPGTAAGADYRMTSMILTHDNNMMVSPTRVSSVYRLSEGCIPGQRTGTLSVAQDKNAANALPSTSSNPVFYLDIASGDGTLNSEMVISTSFSDTNLNIQPDQLVRSGRTFVLFNPSPTGDLAVWGTL